MVQQLPSFYTFQWTIAINTHKIYNCVYYYYDNKNNRIKMYTHTSMDITVVKGISVPKNQNYDLNTSNPVVNGRLKSKCL